MAQKGGQRKRLGMDAVERLYVLWILSTIILILGFLFLSLFTRAALRERDRTMAELVDRVTALEAGRGGTTTAPAAGEGRMPRNAERGAADRPAVQPDQPRRPEENGATGADGGARVSPPTDERARTPDIAALLTRAIEAEDPLAPTLADPGAAQQALASARQSPDAVGSAGDTWARLAVAAQLLGRDEDAQSFAMRARAAGSEASGYLALAARAAVASGDLAAAQALAQRLVEAAGERAEARMLLAEIDLALDRPELAVAAIAPVAPQPQWPAAQRLRFGRIALALERWGDLEAVLQDLPQVPDELADERDFQRAVLLIEQSRRPDAPAGALVEPLAILNYLLGQDPQSYQLQVWRGVALLEAGQLDAARQALTAAASGAPGLPDAWYWRGAVEMRAGQPDQAAPHLEKALAASASYAPAWEALGIMALNRGDLSSALENLASAIQVNPARASAHFLSAVASAKASRRIETLAALQAAIALDPSYAQKALATDAITGVVNADEIQAIVERVGNGRAADQRAPAESAPQRSD